MSRIKFIDAEYATMPAEGDAPVVMQMCGMAGSIKVRDSTIGGHARKARPRQTGSCWK